MIFDLRSAYFSHCFMSETVPSFSSTTTGVFQFFELNDYFSVGET